MSEPSKLLGQSSEVLFDLYPEVLFLILDWIYRFRYTFRDVLIKLIEVDAESVLFDMFEQGFIQEALTKAGQGKKRGKKPHTFITLTALGVKTVRSKFDYAYTYPKNPLGTEEKLFRHSSVIQAVTAERLNLGLIIAFSTEKDNATLPIKGVKKHDVIWIDKYHQRVGVEVELSPKESENKAKVSDSKTLNYFVSACIDSIETDEVGRKVIGILIFSDSDELLKRYQAAFKVGETFTKIRPVGSQSKGPNQFQIPMSLSGRILCLKN